MRLSSGVLASLLAAGAVSGCATTQIPATQEEKRKTRKELEDEKRASEPSAAPKPAQQKADECFACGMG